MTAGPAHLMQTTYAGSGSRRPAGEPTTGQGRVWPRRVT
jgi:hypothetical protein